MTTVPVQQPDRTLPQRQRSVDTLAAKVDAIHRYWLREFGHHPDPDDSMLIVSVIAALDELHAGAL